MSMRALLARIAGMFAGPRRDAEMREELEAHLEMEIDEYVRRGLSPEEARRRALMASGGMTQAAEAVRDQRGLPSLEALFGDFRYAIRALRHSPSFTLVVVLTLGLGIGANTAIFSVVRGVLLKPLPHREGSRLVYLRQSADGPGQSSLSFSVPEVRDLRQGAPALAGGIAEYSQWSGILYLEEGAERIQLGLVTGNYFDVMGLAPILGRLTGPEHDGAGVAPVMVLSHAFWLRRFGGDSSVVGTQVRVGTTSATVIGVLEPAPPYPNRADALMNMVISPHHLSASMVEARAHRMTEVFARLAPGATVDQARSEVATVYTRLQQQYPDAYEAAAHYRVAVIPFQEVLGERAKTTLWLLMGAAGFVLIISAANVANLTLMRGVRREHELLVRAALGAGASRLRRLLLAENLVLALAGAALGVAIALGGVRLLTALAERYSPRAAEIRVDAVVLGFALGISVILALLLSFVAALPREGTFAGWIAAGGRRQTAGQRRQRVQRVLVVAQVAVTVVLLAGAGLLTRTMILLSSVSTGLESEEVLTMQVPLLTASAAIANPGQIATAGLRYQQIRDEIAALPGVLAVGLGSPMPLRRSSVYFELKAEGHALQAGEAVPTAELRTAGPEFFRASGIPIVAGRPFAATDDATSGKVVVINRALADRFFAGQDPVGKRVAFTGQVLRFTPITDEWRTVVGVVANTRDGGPDAEPRAVMYLPFTQFPPIGTGFAIRTEGDPTDVVLAATRVIRRLAPDAPIENVLTLSQIRDESIAPRRLNAVLVSLFGLLAVLIAAVGIAGVLAFSVSARINEIGIRMSLGADSFRVQRMIISEGGILVLAGLVLGTIGASVATRVMQNLLYGVTPRDPVTFGAVVVVMAIIGLVACWIPAIRAARIDPAITMRA